jgi:hypothetical protein
MLIPLLEQTLQPPHLVRCSGRSWIVEERHRVDIAMEALGSQSLRGLHYAVSWVSGQGHV